jgi:chromosome partitioning protein
MHIAVVNLKGGVGKTTTAVHIASGLAADGRCLLVDADPQGSALSWSEEAEGLRAPVIALPVKDLHRRLPTIAEPYRHVVIDTPPGQPPIVESALRAADLALVPVQATVLDLDRVTATIDLIIDAQALGRLYAAVLLTRTRARTRSLEAAREVLGEFGLHVLDAEVPQRESLAAAFGDRLDDLGPYEPVVDELRSINMEARR